MRQERGDRHGGRRQKLRRIERLLHPKQQLIVDGRQLFITLFEQRGELLLIVEVIGQQLGFIGPCFERNG
jgi:hypothetical protein